MSTGAWSRTRVAALPGRRIWIYRLNGVVRATIERGRDSGWWYVHLLPSDAAKQCGSFEEAKKWAENGQRS
jgi:hypothetical protein